MIKYVHAFYVKILMKILIYGLTYLVPKRKNTFITSTGRRDGMGTQVIGVYSAMAYCKAYQKTYVHTPMGYVDHNFYN